MDKYEYKLKLDQIKSLVAAEDYETAAAIADSINWERVRNANTLMMVARIYEETNQFDACRDVLLHAYDHSSLGRNIVSQLADVAIKAKRVEEAEEYYNEFLEIAPRDNKRYVMAYKISCLKNAPLTDRIAILEELKEKEYSEIWAYELAALYSEAGMRDKCVETCDELILWFGEGSYVERALDLKRKYQPLTAAQEEKYHRLRAARGIVDVDVPKKVEASISEETGLPAINVTSVSPSRFNTMNLQEELAKSMQQIMEATERETVNDTMDSIKKIVNDIPYLSGDMEETGQEVFDQERINEAVDEKLKADFEKRMASEYGKRPRPADKRVSDQISGQMSIEEVLSEWEKTKLAAEEAIAAAEQKKLELAKEQALREANEIMGRLQSLLPVLSAEPGDEMDEEAQTVAAALRSNDPNIKDPDEKERDEIEKQIIVQTIARETAAAEAAAKKAAEKAAEKTAEKAGSGREQKGFGILGKAKHAEAEDAKKQDDSIKEPEIDISVKAAEEPESAAAEEVTAEEPEIAVTEEVTAEEPEPAVTEEAAAEEPEIAVTEEVTAEEPEITVTEEAAAEEPEPAVTEEVTAEGPEITVTEEAAEEPEPAVTEEVTAEEPEPAVTEEAAAEEPEKEDSASSDRLSETQRLENILASAAIDINMEEQPEEKVPSQAAAKPVQADAPETEWKRQEETAPVPETEQASESAPEEKQEAEASPLQEEIQESEDTASYGGILSEEDRKMFSYFLPVPGVEEQICQVLRDAENHIGHTVTSLTGNIIVQGEEGSGKTVLATSLIRAIQKIVGKEDAKIGKISAEALNRKDFSALVPRLEGGYLIIDKAGELTKQTVQKMSAVMEKNTQGLVIILEDDSAGIRKALGQDPLFAKKFTGRVKIPVFTIDELVEFGKSYAQEMECVMEDMAVLALYNRINNIRRLDHPTTLAEVKEIVDQAIESAEGGGIKKLFAKKYNTNDYLILREKDFEMQ